MRVGTRGMPVWLSAWWTSDSGGTERQVVRPTGWCETEYPIKPIAR